MAQKGRSEALESSMGLSWSSAKRVGRSGAPTFWTGLVALLDAHPVILLAACTLAYFVAVLPEIFKPLWYDEILTYYAATATSFSRFALGIRHFDFNPPLLYGLEWISIRLFGNSTFAVRLPSIVAFFGAAFVILWHERERTRNAHGFIAFGLLLSSPFLIFATDARPYALVLLFVSVCFSSWIRGIQHQHWSWAHTCLMAGTAGLFLTHCFAPIFVLAVVCGELTRIFVRRRSDWRILLAVGMPCSLAIFYVAMVRSLDAVLFPFQDMASPMTFLRFFGSILSSLAFPSGLLVAAAYLAPGTREGGRVRSLVAPHEVAFFAAAVAAPAVVILYTIHTHMPFGLRYGIGVAVPACLLLARLFEKLSKRSNGAAVLGILFILIPLTVDRLILLLKNPPTSSVDRILTLAPDLPIVAASGSRFLEIDHYGSSDVVKRLYYLTDRVSAIRYAHDTLFEDFSLIKLAYPVRATVAPYYVFVGQHKHFWVVALPEDSHQDWLLAKLKADGAQITPRMASPWLFEVAVRQ